MKKYLAIAAAATAIIFAATSCDEKPQPEPVVETTLSVNPTSVTLQGAGETVKLAIETNAETVLCTPGADWIQASVSGKELTLTAAANPTEEPRNTEVTLTAGDKQAKVQVTQAAGSKYPGYTRATAEESTYLGYMYQKLYDVEDGDGGSISINLASPDGRYSLHIEAFTTLFEAEEDVCLSPGTYTKGADDPAGAGFVCKAMTWVPGCAVVIEDEEGTEELPYGSWLTTTIGENITDAKVTSGSFTVEEKDGGYLIKTDLTTEDGTAINFYYEGVLEIDSDGAIYPGEPERPEITSFVWGEITYMGEAGENSTQLELTLYCDEEGNYPMISYTFYVPTVSFENLANTDLSGAYYVADGEESFPFDPGTVEIGTKMEIEGFTFPMGSYVIYGMLDYMIPDGMVSLILARNEEGKYNVTGAMATADFSAFCMFMDETTYIPFEYNDGTAYDDED